MGGSPEQSSNEPNANLNNLIHDRIREQRDVANMNTARYIQVLLDYVSPDHMGEVIETSTAANKSLTDIRWVTAMLKAVKEILPNDKETRRKLVLRAWDIKDEEERIAEDSLRSSSEETSGEY